MPKETYGGSSTVPVINDETIRLIIYNLTKDYPEDTSSLLKICNNEKFLSELVRSDYVASLSTFKLINFMFDFDSIVNDKGVDKVNLMGVLVQFLTSRIENEEILQTKDDCYSSLVISNLPYLGLYGDKLRRSVSVKLKKVYALNLY